MKKVFCLDCKHFEIAEFMVCDSWCKKVKNKHYSAKQIVEENFDYHAQNKNNNCDMYEPHLIKKISDFGARILSRIERTQSEIMQKLNEVKG